MSAKDEITTLGLDRLNALLAWWGIATTGANGKSDGQVKRLQAFAADLQAAYGEAYSAQMTTLFAANERIAGSLQELLHCRQPQDVIAAEANVCTTILEGASQQAKTWFELSQKVQGCCASMARDAVEDLGKQAGKETAIKPAARPSQSAAKHPSKNLVHA